MTDLGDFFGQISRIWIKDWMNFCTQTTEGPKRGIILHPKCTLVPLDLERRKFTRINRHRYAKVCKDWPPAPVDRHGECCVVVSNIL